MLPPSQKRTALNTYIVLIDDDEHDEHVVLDSLVVGDSKLIC